MSGNRTIYENVGTQLKASDLIVGSALNRGPPIRVEQDFINYPVRNGLLRDSLLTKGAHSFSQGALTACDLDSPLQGANVVLLHGKVKYTRNLVVVNKNRCFSLDKDACTVLEMSTNKRNLVAVPTPKTRKAKAKPARAVELGPDGKTFGQRVTLLMTDANVGQTGLARMCSEYYATFVPAIQDKVKQQHIFNIIHGQESSSLAPLIAAVFEVSDIWLALGIGHKERKSN